ncbi:hypothetical protein [Niabella sp.]|uniref:hypothetical protein n=1 Tax=Niabella sp. TaxID=1962976 RepID=UPI0026296F48|nr:hypothetical protein [Niabella sp.]
MIEERNVIYFDPFYFKNGNTAKPKYFVVLKHTGIKSVIASLPTRKDTIPFDENIDEGCIELPDINLNCFVLPKDLEITECGKFFTFKTYLYGHQIDEYNIELLEEIYPNEGSDYEIWGKMKSEIFDKLLDCFRNSKTVKRKYKKML